MNALTNGILVSIPHSGIQCPSEINRDDLSFTFNELTDLNVDWYTHLIYDFTDILFNKQIIFPYNQILINVNRHPENLDESVPFFIENMPVYCNQPSYITRKMMIHKYHMPYHLQIAKTEKIFILDGHSMNDAAIDIQANKKVYDIDISNFQQSKYHSPEGFYSAPQKYLDIYANELQKRLPNLTIGINATYCNTYGHIMAEHGTTLIHKDNKKAPLLLQETNEKIYLNNGKPDMVAINSLRHIFAEAIKVTLNMVNRKVASFANIY